MPGLSTGGEGRRREEKVKELPRRLWHIFGGLSLPISGWLVPENVFLPTLISITIAFLVFELIRLKFSPLNRHFLAWFHVLLRERERSTLTASAYLLIAASIVFIFYDKAIAVMALTFVALGDPVAGMVRDVESKANRVENALKLRIKGKGLKGSGACLLCCLIAGAVLASVAHLNLWLPLIGAICATLVEFLSLRINDNLTIPLLAGGAMMAAKLAIM